MGKGTIISGGADGQYQVEVNFYREKINAEIASLEVRITALEDRIALTPIGPERDVVRLQKTALEKRKDFLENNIPEDETISAWCADFSEEITGNVGTIEVPGERGTLLIQPGYQDNALYSADRDGQLLPTVGASPEQYFYNLAMLPGWQKWKPTFRFGVIDSRDGNTADVTLEAAISSQQDIDVNQTTTLTSVPIEYMACNGGVFEPGDAVLIMFENQNWETPKIIGFKDNPKPCFPWLVVRLDWDVYGTNTAFVWDIDANAFATAIPDGAGGFVPMPCEYNDLAYWLGLTSDVNESRHWTTRELENPLAHIYFPDREPWEGGSQYEEYIDPFTCAGNDILSYISRSWTKTSIPTYHPWEPDPDELPRERLIEVNGTQDETSDYLIKVVDNEGFCFKSKTDESLDFKVNLSEKTDKTKDIDIYAKIKEYHWKPPPPDWRIGVRLTWLKNTFTYQYGETREMTMETPVGDFQVYSVSEPNSIDYEDVSGCGSIVKGDYEHYLYEFEIDYFGTPVNHSETVFCQICILQAVSTTWEGTSTNRCLPDEIGLDGDFKNMAKTGDDVEKTEEDVVKIIAYIGIEEDGIIAGEYDPKTAELNEELSDAVKQIIIDRGEPIETSQVRFRM